ncbi:unnamed protein product, partial [Rotaria sp. Silwood2]
IEDDQGTADDDTSANGFKSRCWNGKPGNFSNVSVEGKSSGPWGIWKSEAVCPEGSAICGISSKFQESQGSGDDTAMNGAFFKCCSLNSARSDETSELRPSVGPFGDFHRYVYCSEGTWAYGFQQRVESAQGSSDDTALNAIRLYCRKKDGTGVESISSYDGVWGNWTGVANCSAPSAPFMFSGSFKIEDDQGISGDDTSANGFRSRCWNGKPGNFSNVYVEGKGSGTWGFWKTEAACSEGSAICGISSKFQDSQGSSDDTAMNGAFFKCCSL